jgi:hypothetical protein
MNKIIIQTRQLTPSRTILIKVYSNGVTEAKKALGECEQIAQKRTGLTYGELLQKVVDKTGVTEFDAPEFQEELQKLIV